MKKLLTAICFIGLMGFTANQAIAQIGVKGGLALGNISTSFSAFGFEMEETSGTKVGFSAGIFTQFPVGDMFAIQPELLYTLKGGVDDEDVFNGGGETSISLSYVEVPVLFRFNVPLDGDYTPYLYAGPHIGFLIDATESNGSSEDISEFLEDFNYGLSIGGGVSFGKFFVDIRYDMGLANIADTSQFFDEFNGNMGNFEMDMNANAFLITGGITF